jgi:hypothetical protein
MSESLPENYGQGESGPESTESTTPETPSTTGESTSTTTDSTQQEPTGYNPSWNEAFDLIPIEDYREKLKPVFEKWDKHNNQRYEQVQQKYAPYQVLADNNVAIDDVRQAFELRNQIAANPQEVFQRLAQHLGIDLSKLDSNGDESQGLNEYPDEEDDPRFKELKRQQESILTYLQTQAQQEEQARLAKEQQAQETNWYNETKSTLDSLEQKYGTFDRNRVVQFAVWEAEKTGKPVDLEVGLRAMREFTQSAIQSSANASAPDVFSGNGALVSGRVDTSKMSEAEFEKYAIERIAAKNAGR